jgi:hypothetical protein
VIASPAVLICVKNGGVVKAKSGKMFSRIGMRYQPDGIQLLKNDNFGSAAASFGGESGPAPAQGAPKSKQVFFFCHEVFAPAKSKAKYFFAAPQA